MYRAFGLLRPVTDFTLAVAVDRLRIKFPQYAVTLHGQQITISHGDWEMEVLLNAEPYVKTESEGLAMHVAGLEPGDDFGNCERRVELWSDTPDPFLEHFNDYLEIVAVLKSFDGLVAVDPKTPELL